MQMYVMRKFRDDFVKHHFKPNSNYANNVQSMHVLNTFFAGNIKHNILSNDNAPFHKAMLQTNLNKMLNEISPSTSENRELNELILLKGILEISEVYYYRKSHLTATLNKIIETTVHPTHKEIAQNIKKKINDLEIGITAPELSIQYEETNFKLSDYKGKYVYLCFFRGWDLSFQKELEIIVKASDKRSLLRGDVLFRENDKPNSLFLVESGRIAIVNKSFIGKESVVALMENGDLFGEMGLFDNRGRSAEARALEESCVIEVPYEPINKLYEKDPSQLWEVVTMLVGRLRNMDEVLADSVFLDVTGRTAKRLLEISDNEDEFSLPVTQEELAGMVGASRERVNKAIASFIKLGWIEQFDRTYRILDREQLTIRSR